MSLETEDVSPVTKHELAGWYSSQIAVEGFATLGSGAFPLILQGLVVASSSSFNHYDHTQRCDSTGQYNCDILFGSVYINSSSLVLYANTAATLLQLFVFIGCGSLADYGPNRKLYLMASGVVSSMLGVLMLAIVSTELWVWSYLLYLLISITLGPFYIFMSAYIPILTRYSVPVLEAMERDESPEEIYDLSDRISNELSSKGIAYAYMASLVQILVVGGTLFPLLGMNLGSLPSVYPYQIAIAFISVIQFLVLVIFTRPRLRERPGPPLPPHENYFTLSFRLVWKQLKQARSLSQLFLFLIGWFLYSDAFSSLGSVVFLFAQSQLGADSTILVISSITLPISCAFGAVFFNRLQARYSYSTKSLLVLQNSLYLVYPVYVLLGFFTAPLGFGLVNKWELIPLGVLHGVLIGAAQSTCRALFSELLPKGHEAQFFSLYEITNHGSSWIGPLVSAALGNSTGSLRYAFVFVLASMVLSAAVFSKIDIEKGREECKLFLAAKEPADPPLLDMDPPPLESVETMNTL
ncbi:Autophagy protein 22 [Kappamyces sp. JEL0680]|nr:Autophagy protein 22 [Kappamyces sp. JEL0680]